jgi:HNH endonuclease
MNDPKTSYPQDFLDFVGSITNKRAKIVIDHILAHGFITTEDLENTYAYSHPPRAARDVREAGIPLETFKVKSTSGKSIAAYKFGDVSKLQRYKVGGRALSPKEFKHELYESNNGKCFVCNGAFEERYLQVDHKIPYEVDGDRAENLRLEDFMLLCGSCNRAKSWSCEHCDNWKTGNNPAMCLQCYWGNPTTYNHIALKDIKRLDLQWAGDEVGHFEALKIVAEQHNVDLPDFVKQLIAEKVKHRPF